jgi:choline kinase
VSHVRPVHAIVLAAGVARRLAPLTDRTNKCLLPVGGRSLLDRMLAALAASGVPETTIVVGHCADQVRALAGTRFGGMRLSYIDNPEYRRGSVLSLHAAREVLRAGPALVMDADVMFPREFLRRLLAADGHCAVLVDRGFADTGEEQKAYSRDGRVITLSKKVVPPAWDAVGENVGFFRTSDAGADLVALLEQVIAEGTGLEEYEEAIHRLMQRHAVQPVDVTGLPWTEMDFVEDLRRAEAEVLPRVVALDGS